MIFVSTLVALAVPDEKHHVPSAVSVWFAEGASLFGWLSGGVKTESYRLIRTVTEIHVIL